MKLSAEQQAAVTRQGQDVCCVAGPGSGKTRVLVERFAWLVDKGEDPESILAITYTEKAAREVKTRLVARFSAGRELRQKVERSPVSTIHGLCHALLKENAVVAGLDPEFSVMDEREARVELEASARKVLEELLEESAEGFERLFDSLASETPLADLIEVHKQLRNRGGARAAWAESRDLSAEVARTAEAVREALRDALDALDRGEVKRTELRQRWVWVLNGLINGDAGEQWFEQMGTLDLRSSPRVDEFRAAVKRARELLKEARAARLWVDRAAERETLMLVLERVELEYKRRKQALSVLDFADLEEQAEALLEGNLEVAREVAARYSAILMDELQDTNPTQWRIVDRLRRPGRFFGVGDLNQSIFAFRDADPKLFEGYIRQVESSGGVVDRLERNYRSRPEILGAVQALVDGGGLPGVLPHRLVPREDEFPPAQGPVIEVQKLEEGTEAWAEAMWVARRLAEIKQERPELKWSDMAVLARATKRFDLMEAALGRFGIPCVILKGRNFFDEPEVGDFRSWMRVMARERDLVAVLALLRSPFFGMGDEEIFLSAESGAFPPKDVEERLRAMRLRMGEAGAALELRRFAAETGYGNRLSDGGRANLDKFCDLLSSLEDSHSGEHRLWLDIMSSMEAEREPNAPRGGAPEAVQLLTIHKSKGLEFKVVALIEMDRTVGGQEPAVNYSAQWGLGARWRDATGLQGDGDLAYLRTPGERARTEESESDRLLYVAMTRAEERLLLSWRETARRRSSWPETVERGLQLVWETAGEESTVAPIRARVVSGAPETLVAEPAPAAELEWMEVVEPEREGVGSVPATELARLGECPRRFWLDRVAGWPDFGEQEGFGTGLGSEVHRLLAGESPHGAREEAVQLGERFLSSDVGRKAARARRVEREFDFLIEHEGVLVRGVMDLWFEDEDGVTLIDYKTGHPGEARLREYRIQLDIYGEALKRLNGRRPERSGIYLLSKGEMVWVEDAGGALMTEAMAELKGCGESGEWTMVEGKQCARCRFWRGACPSRYEGET